MVFDDKLEFEALGKSGVSDIGGKLETFPCPQDVQNIQMTSDEVTALCPVTGQPDMYVITIDYQPGDVCIESKSLKLLFQSFRNRGLFVEQLASDLLQVVKRDVRPMKAAVAIRQKSRGGITIEVTAFE